MASSPREPDGLGQPTGGQPSVMPPPADAAPPDAAPSAFPAGHPAPDASGTWLAPTPDTRFAAAPPSGRGPGVRRHHPRRVLVASVLAGTLVLVGILSALPMLPTGQVPQAAASPGIVTVGPSAPPGPATTVTSGGGLGAPVAFQTEGGAGTVTVHSAVWTDAGELPPVEGERYLVLDVSVACTSGEVPVEALWFLVEGADGLVLPGFGADLESPMGGRLLAAGEQIRGQLGYSLPAGTVTVELLDEQLRPVAGIEVPGP